MIKDIFKEYKFTFNQWNRLFLCDALFIRIFPNTYCYFDNERKKNMLLNN